MSAEEIKVAGRAPSAPSAPAGAPAGAPPGAPAGADALPTATANPAPSKEQLQFARAVYIIFHLWPAMRHAVAEAWGGADSRAKMEYLLSYICDEYGDLGEKTRPEMDDLADLFEDYLGEEFECRLEDDSAAWAGAHIVDLHARIFTHGDGDAALAELERSYTRLGPSAVAVREKRGEEGEDEGDEEEDEDEGEGEDACCAHGPAGAPVSAARARTPPPVDEDGFQTVVPRRRR